MDLDGSSPLSLLDDQAYIPIYPTAKIEKSKQSVEPDSQPHPENIIRIKGYIIHVTRLENSQLTKAVHFTPIKLFPRIRFWCIEWI